MKITILATSDTHGFIPPTNFVNLHENMPFGLEKAAFIIDQYKKHHPDEKIITIDNGDFLEGSPLSDFIAASDNEFVKQAYAAAYNAVDYDFGTIGNHEFDYGMDYLQAYIQASDRQFLCANLVDQNDQPLLGKPYQIVDMNGLKVAFLGLTTTSSRKWKFIKNLKNFNLKSAVQTAKALMPEIKQQADVVIGIYHGGFERDINGNWNDITVGENEGYELLQSIPEIDALVTGHQHRKIATKLFDRPTIQPGYRGQFVGKISLDIDPITKQIQHSDAQLIDVEKAFLDPKVYAIITPIVSELNQWLDNPVAIIDGDLTFRNAFDARVQETAYIELIQKIQMDKMGVDVSATAVYNNEAHGFENPITMRNIITNYVYPNTLVVSQISGKDLREALETSAQYFAEENGNLIINPEFLFPKHRFYNYDMYEGIEYDLDISRPIGQRVTKLKYHDKDVLDEDQLKVALNKYRALGGGHYGMFTKDKIIHEDNTPIQQIIFEYLQKNPLIIATCNNNFKIYTD